MRGLTSARAMLISTLNHRVSNSQQKKSSTLVDTLPLTRRAPTHLTGMLWYFVLRLVRSTRRVSGRLVDSLG